MARIEDGKGKNGDASVSSVQRLNVSAKTQPRMFYQTRDFGLGYVAVFDPISAAAGEHIAYLKNTSSTRNLFLTRIEFGSAEAVVFKVSKATGTAAAGETITPTNLNFGSNLTAEAEAMAGNTAITGLTTDGLVGVARTTANGEATEDYEGAVQLGPNDAIVAEYDSGTSGTCSVSMFFFYETIGAA